MVSEVLLASKVFTWGCQGVHPRLWIEGAWNIGSKSHLHAKKRVKVSRTSAVSGLIRLYRDAYRKCAAQKTLVASSRQFVASNENIKKKEIGKSHEDFYYPGTVYLTTR